VLRAAGASRQSLAARNYALVQLMLQTGIRVGELAALRVGDITINDRSGSVRIREGKGLKAREVPLNATARRAIRTDLDTRASVIKTGPLFFSNRDTSMPVRSIQAVIAGIARRARMKRVPISAHTLRHYVSFPTMSSNRASFAILLVNHSLQLVVAGQPCDTVLQTWQIVGKRCEFPTWDDAGERRKLLAF